MSSFGSLCKGLLQRSIVLACKKEKKQQRKKRQRIKNYNDSDEVQNKKQGVSTDRALGVVGAPGLAPEPLLGQTEDGHLVLGIVGQVLVQVGQTVGVARQLVVGRAQGVTHGIASVPTRSK